MTEPCTGSRQGDGAMVFAWNCQKCMNLFHNNCVCMCSNWIARWSLRQRTVDFKVEALEHCYLILRVFWTVFFSYLMSCQSYRIYTCCTVTKYLFKKIQLLVVQHASECVLYRIVFLILYHLNCKSIFPINFYQTPCFPYIGCLVEWPWGFLMHSIYEFTYFCKTLQFFAKFTHC